MKNEDDNKNERLNRELPNSYDKICFGDIKLDVDDSENNVIGCGCLCIGVFVIIVLILSC